MNADKAREFFSSYFEGTLDAGLRQAFELRLETDAETQAEYRAFERSMGQLDTLKDIEIEIPYDLNEKISARVDRHIFEAKRTKGSPWLAFLRPMAIGGLAAAAIIGTVITMNNRSGGVQPAGLTTGSQPPKIETPAPKGFNF